MKKGDIISVEAEELIYPREGLAHYQGKKIRIDQALPGQRLQVRVIRNGDKRALAKTLSVEERAPYEKAPLCSFTHFCGGCSFPTVPYETQVRWKGREVLEQLSKNQVQVEEFEGIQGCQRLTGYRNKMEYTFGDEEKGGRPALGMHRKGRYMDIVTVSDCVIAPADFNRIVEGTLAFFTQRGIPFYRKKERTGFQRNLIIRRGERTGELLVNLVSTSQASLDKKAFVDCLLALELDEEICGITHTINDSVSDFVYCDSLEVLWGRGYYREEILGLTFQVSPFSFFQTNTLAAERLYQEALGMIDELEGKRVFDLYCGTGTISQIMALKAKEVVGVEIVEEAVGSARENAALNGLDNCRFVAADVFDALDELKEPPDLMVLDPPRAGILPKTLSKILAYRSPQILYISCNPLTMAQNLAVMQQEGYQVMRLKAYDNFPWTKHIECCCLLQREEA